MNLPIAPNDYSKSDQASLRQELARCDGLNLKSNQGAGHILLESPNGSVFMVTVSNAGALVVAAY